MELTQQSPRCEQPRSLLPLKDHQLAMLNRCMKIENSKKGIGVMSDVPGSGKTFVILSLIMNSPSTRNIIVVPINIYSQWIEAITKFCGSRVTYSKYIEYQDVSRLYFQKNEIRKSQIILTTPLYYNIIIDAMDNAIVDRVIIDEIDSVSSIIRQSNITKMMWFVSASFNVNEFSKLQRRLELNELSSVTCRTDPKFVKQCFAIPDFESEIIVCKNLYIDTLMYGMVSDIEYERLNALDFAGVRTQNTAKIATNEQEAVEYFVKDLNETIAKTTQALESLESKLGYDMDDEAKCLLQAQIKENIEIKATTQAKLECMIQRITDSMMCLICYCDIENKVITTCCQNAFCSRCLYAWLNTKTQVTPSCPVCRESPVDYLRVCETDDVVEEEQSSDLNPETNNKKSKIEAFKELLEEQLGSKIIIMSNYRSVFNTVVNVLREQDIEYVELDGGNIQNIDKDVQKYRNGNARVLMTNSSLYGCGMNLENTTDIVVMHKLTTAMTEQIIGRAQRPGRNSVLKVWHMFHENEMNEFSFPELS
jgi:SNF2-related domain/Helicase conserved C-terminal domain